ncbi:MAG: DUF2141 domain-containing protein [Alphaproteobacteria bacterium]|nr:DUF2141 domain-containing protein [Alphaproteobacteria bacterium]
MVKVRITVHKIKCKIYYFLLLLLITPYFAVSANANTTNGPTDIPTGVLRVNINKIMPDGQYMVLYLCSEDQFLKAPCDLTMMKIANAASKTFTLRDAPAGDWTIVMFHDQDGDGKMKRGLIFPKEGYGFSVWEGRILSKPNYNKFKFTIKANQTNDVSVLMRY